MSQCRLRDLVRPFTEEEDCCSTRLRLALQMMDAGVDMKRLSLARQHPAESSELIEERLRRWLQEQPVGPDFRLRPPPPL